MKTLVHFGAGAIGRSLVGSLFSAAGWRVVFVDVDRKVVDAMNARGGYTVWIKDTLPPGDDGARAVTRVSGVWADDAEGVASAAAAADLWGTSVGAGALPKLFPAMAEALRRREANGGGAVSVLLCENLHGAGTLVREGLRKLLPGGFPLDDRLGVVETSIGKMVPLMPAAERERDPLAVWGEAYNRIVADRDGFKGSPPEVDGLECHDHFQAWVERKLYLHNFGHAAAAYLGHCKARYRFIWECVEDSEVYARTREAMLASASALGRRHAGVFAEGALEAHVDDLLRRFGNRALDDTVFRVGRDLPRKLAPGDRLLGTLDLVHEAGGDVGLIWRVIAAALSFDAVGDDGKPFPADESFRRQMLDY